jgi:predicted extracellular nuclease
MVNSGHYRVCGWQMSEVYHDLESGNFFENWNDISRLQTGNDWSGVRSIMGYRGETLTARADVDARSVTGSSANAYVAVNQTDPNGYITAGVAEFQLANPTIAIAGSSNTRAPYIALYLNATGRENVTLSFVARDLESGPDNAVQQIVVQYRIGDTGAWTNVPGGYIADATVANATMETALSVVLPSAVNGQAQVQVRIMTTDTIGFDEWVGIDDINVTSQRDPDYRPAMQGIFEIQGEGHISAFAGRLAQTQGIVTATDTNGFFIQDANGDGNARTSDAIFVRSSSLSGISVGDAVTVFGRVNERVIGSGLTRTEISAEDVDVVSSGNTLPAAVLIGNGAISPPSSVIEDDAFASFDTATDGIDFWEALEGMRVTVDAPQVVSNTNNDGETNIIASGGSGATGINSRGAIAISEGDLNPEVIQIDDRFLSLDEYSVGDRLESVTGVLNYSNDQFELLVTNAFAVTQDVTLTREVTALVGDANHLTIASYNMSNLDPGDTRFAALALDISVNLHNPDVIALQQILDADGTGTGNNLSGTVTAQLLIDAIFAQSGVRYTYAEIAPTSANSTAGILNGNTRPGYLYREDRVSLVEGSLSQIPDPVFEGTRRPLVATWSFNGTHVTTINVDLTTRVGSDALWGADQQPTIFGAMMRTQQIAAIRNFVDGQISLDANQRIMIAGDWNGYAFENAQLQLTSGGQFTNLAMQLDTAERYSEIVDGSARLPDNILVSSSLLDAVQYDIVHINSEFAGLGRASDRDPQITRIFLPSAPTNLVLSNGVIAENSAAGTVVGTLSATDSAGETLSYALLDDADGRFSVDPVTGQLTANQSFNFESGDRYAVIVRVTDSSGLSTAMSFEINIANVNEAPVTTSAISQQNIAEDTAFSLSVPAGMFNDVDAGDTLILSVSALPSWLSFDAATRTFSGTPSNADVGSFEITLTATDSNGAGVNSSFRVNVENVNDAPTGTVLSSNSVDENSVGGTVVGTLSALDMDIGDTHSYRIADVSYRLDQAILLNPLQPISMSFAGSVNGNSKGLQLTSMGRITVADGQTYTVWRVRNASGTDQNLRLNPVSGTADREFFAAAHSETFILSANTSGSASHRLYSGNTLVDTRAASSATFTSSAMINVTNPNFEIVGDQLIVRAGANLDFENAAVTTVMVEVTDAAGQRHLQSLTVNIRDVFEYAGTPTLQGTEATNIINGTVNDDIIHAYGGNDIINAGNGDDIVVSGGGNDLITGGNGSDTLYGGSGNDHIRGDNGNDVLIGGLGSDFLVGGNGSDTFRFLSIADSPSSNPADRDSIMDFKPNNDVIDLSAIDANVNLAGNQAFIYIGSTAFSNVAGQLRYINGVLSADVDGDGVADFEVTLLTQSASNPGLGISDFIL